ncbi:MAG: transporter [Gemmatimonadota bacterium]|nr:MAG: transporter [Gemmatimonadota bacterium]
MAPTRDGERARGREGGARRASGWLVALLLLLPATVAGQELEPRALANVPVGWNFAVLGYGYATGNILLDPAVPIEDLNSRVHTVVGAYVRSLSLFGLSSKLNVLVPFASGSWEGQLEGQDTSRAVTGFGDPRVALSLNFVGAPALRASEARSYQQKTIVGANLRVTVPLGQYDPSKLINLGSNRWTFRLQVGASHATGPWILEAYAAAWFFTANPDFFGGSKLEQQPLSAFKLHLIRSVGRRFWIALDGGYGIGGRSAIDDVDTETLISTFRFGLTGAFQVAPQHTVRLVLASGKRVLRGADHDAIALTYQFRWGGS